MAATAPASTAIHLPWPLNTFTFGSIEDLSPSTQPTKLNGTSPQGIHVPAALYSLIPDRLLYTLNAGTRGIGASESKRSLKEGIEGISALGEFCRQHVNEATGGWFLDAV